MDSLLAVDGGRQVVWAGLGDRPEGEAWELVTRYAVPAATLVDAGTDARRAWVALQVAAWLSEQRTAGGLVYPCLTAWTPPTPPTGTVRVPHLVSVAGGTAMFDAVVWELADLTTARVRVGLPSDWEFFDRHLPVLLALRRVLRTGQAPATPVARRVLELTWARGEDLSIELVYAHADLFRPLVQTWPAHRVGDGGGHR